jgi:hypothetical protein
VAYSGGRESFVYNALGQRMKLTVSGVVTRYVYDGDPSASLGAGRVLEETDSSGNVLARYTTTNSSYYGPWLHLWRTGGVSRYPLYDAVGSVRRLVDDAGVKTDAYALTAFGKDRGNPQPTPNPYRFGGAWGYINGISGLQQLGPASYLSA